MNKKIIPVVASTLVISATALLTFSNNAIAKTGIVYNVETGLIIRDTPSKDAKTLDSLLNGASVEVLGEEGNYYKVKYKDITGYVTKSYLKVDGEVPNTEETKTETKTEEKKEETKTETKTEEKKEETQPETKVENTTVTNTTNTTTTNTTATETKTTSSFKAKLLAKANVYVLPLVNTSKLGEIDKDKEVTVISKTGNWCYIQTDTISGWIFTSRVEKVDTPVDNKTEEKKTEEKKEEKTEEKTTSNKKMYFSFEYCNVREKATTDSAKVTSANHNAEVEILGKEGEWYKVSVDGKTGYIREDQLSESQT
ncbi:MAG: SH3 domain-containing protein [Lachnospiraceae bacterium]|nr:SH3 domain-containing protein [Lachnospiraceae bacterium]